MTHLEVFQNGNFIVSRTEVSNIDFSHVIPPCQKKKIISAKK